VIPIYNNWPCSGGPPPPRHTASSWYWRRQIPCLEGGWKYNTLNKRRGQITKVCPKELSSSVALLTGHNNTYIYDRYRKIFLCKLVWNQLPADVLEALSCKPSNFRTRVRKVINKGEVKGGSAKRSEIQWSEVKRSKLCLNEGKDLRQYLFHDCYCSVIAWSFLLMLLL
jgi:hypothetical protein